MVWAVFARSAGLLYLFLHSAPFSLFLKKEKTSENALRAFSEKRKVT